jgi:thiopeptide-type bacteriocin biosynthesis protein
VRWRLQIAAPARLDTVRRAVDRAVAGLHETTLIERFVYDTYHRELERYGGDEGLDVAESVFHIDSDTALDLIAAATGPGATADTRWQTALVSIDRLLGDLGLDLPQRLLVIRRAREAWGTRMHADADVGRQLAKRYRGVRAELARLLTDAIVPDGALGAVLQILGRRSALIRPFIERLLTLQAEGQLAKPIDVLADSYVHMHVNRLIRAEQNLHEVVLYDFLVQLYTERLARLSSADAPQGC